MKIKIKILLSLFLSVTVMFVIFSFIAHKYDKQKYIDITKDQLLSVANIQKHRIEQYLNNNKNLLSIITNRRELSDLLEQYSQNSHKNHLNKINIIIEEFKNSINEIQEVKVTDLQGNILSATDSKLINNKIFPFPLSIEQLQAIKIGLNIKNKDGILVFQSRAPIYSKNKIIGTVYIDVSLDELKKITSDYTGLGKTGETIIAKRTSEGGYILTPRRFDTNSIEKRIITQSNQNSTIFKALNNEISFFQNVKDYRSIEVFAATTYIQNINWGVVVKIDKEELFQNLQSHQNDLYAMLALVIPMVLLLSITISKNLSNPIIELTKTVDAFSKGDFNHKSHIQSNDEVGTLAKTFNKMTEDLVSFTNRLTEAQKVTNMGSWEYDLVSKTLYWSDEVYDIFEVDKNDFHLTYDNFIRCIHNDDKKRVKEAFNKSLKSHSQYSVIHKIITPSGNLKILEERAVHKVDSNGNLSRTFGAVRDITHEKIKEQNLKNQLALTDEHIIISSTDIEGNITYASKAFCEISGYEFSELEGKNHRIVRHPDMSNELYTNLWETIKKEKTWKGIIKNRKKDGGYYWVEASISPVYNLENKLIGYTAIRKDITNEKKIEEAQRIAQMGSWELEIATGKIRGSQQMYEIYELDDKSLLDRNHFIDMIEAKDLDRVLQQLNQAINNLETFKAEFSIKLKNNKRKYIFVQAEVEFDTFKKPLKMIGIILDISERKMIETQLQNAKISAEQASIAKGEFVANMSHEIRTPMNAILGFTDLALRSKNLPEEINEYIKKTKSSASGLLQIINDILDFSKLESQKLDLENIPFNLKNLLAEVISMLEVNANQKGIDLILRLEDLENCYLGDPHRIKQVMINIIGNAIKFTENGSVTLKVYPKRKVIIFEIIDTGIGMSEDQLSTIFDAFVQADASTVRRFGGTGLGTVISKQLVNLMDGNIIVESKIYNGSTFTITLPLTKTPCTESSLYNNTIDHTIVESKRLFNILLAEDNDLNAELVQINLGIELGHKITWAKNGLEVLKELEKPNNFDLILMDIHMPLMDGIETTQKIREKEKETGEHISIIALTASVTKKEQAMTLQYGMDGFALKPLILNDLIDEIENVVPSHLGTKNSKIITTNTIVDKQLNLESLKDIINIEQGLKIWRDENNYLEALEKFCKNHKNDIDILKKSLQNNDKEVVIRIIHTLKGLSLGFDNIHDIIHDIDKQLKISLSSVDTTVLEEEMKKICNAINSIKHNQPTKMIERMDRDDLINSIQTLIDMLDNGENNDDLFKNIVDNLKLLIKNSQVFKLKNSIENFDYEETIKIFNTILIELKDK